MDQVFDECIRKLQRIEADCVRLQAEKEEVLAALSRETTAAVLSSIARPLQAQVKEPALPLTTPFRLKLPEAEVSDSSVPVAGASVVPVAHTNSLYWKFKAFIEKNKDTIRSFFEEQRRHPIDKTNMPIATIKDNCYWLTAEQRLDHKIGAPVKGIEKKSKPGAGEEKQGFRIITRGLVISRKLLGMARFTDVIFEDPRDAQAVVDKIEELHRNTKPH